MNYVGTADLQSPRQSKHEAKIMRYLAIDHGDKKIGLALCDKLELSTKPLPPISNKTVANSVEKIIRILDRNKIEGIVFGLPLGIDNKETQQSIKARYFADQLKKVIELPIELWNETLTTKKALDRMIQQQKSKKTRQEMIDSYSAAVILQEFLENKEIEK